MKKMKSEWIKYGTMAMVGILAAICLSVVCYDAGSLPPDVLEGEWEWMYLCYAVSFVGFAVLVAFGSGYGKEYLPVAVSWTLVAYGCVEAVWGIRQVYGLAYSNHSLYALTGSFYNPGPYSGYLAMTFPVCLHEWLKRKGGRKTIPYYIALAGMLLMLCVLPAGMSRSAWIAAAAASVYVYAMHRGDAIRHYVRSHRKRAVWLAVAGLVSIGLALGGIYLLKKDSADGRLFMWKIAARAVCERPLTGYGWNSVPAAYGQAQEDYFATEGYTPTEERVAGAPEYVFNEYLQVAIAWGIPVLGMGLLVMGGSMYAGHRQGFYGLCGALLALAVFAFSSYPLQFPAFVSAGFLLVAACGIRVFPWGKRGFRLLAAALLLAGSYGCFHQYRQAEREVAACRQWNKNRVFYRSGAYRQAVEGYGPIRQAMKGNARFLFEYGHALHRLHEPEASNEVLEEALKVSGDPMVLNIIGKNHHEMGNYEQAERWLLRSVHRLPGRIYPYYLLACLYADPAFYRRDKLERMVRTVLEKEPKVQSTAVRQMRQQVRKLWEETEKTN